MLAAMLLSLIGDDSEQESDERNIIHDNSCSEDEHSKERDVDKVPDLTDC